jgi:predicted ArsR family transcriptional regulator
MGGPIAIEDTRERILTYLRQNRSANIPDLSRQWGLTRSDLRYHMNNLLSQGLIELATREKTRFPTRGRPIQEYRIASQGDSGNYLGLCHALLNLFEHEDITSGHPGWLQALAEALAGQTPPSISIPQSLNYAVKWLNQRGYHARWEATAHGPRILFFHCPYAAILLDHPELCQVDRTVLEIFLDQPVVQEAKLNPQANTPRACAFTVQLYIK